MLMERYIWFMWIGKIYNTINHIIYSNYEDDAFKCIKHPCDAIVTMLICDICRPSHSNYLVEIFKKYNSFEDFYSFYDEIENILRRVPDTTKDILNLWGQLPFDSYPILLKNARFSFRKIYNKLQRYQSKIRCYTHSSYIELIICDLLHIYFYNYITENCSISDQMAYVNNYNMFIRTLTKKLTENLLLNMYNNQHERLSYRVINKNDIIYINQELYKISEAIKRPIFCLNIHFSLKFEGIVVTILQEFYGNRNFETNKFEDLKKEYDQFNYYLRNKCKKEYDRVISGINIKNKLSANIKIYQEVEIHIHYFCSLMIFRYLNVPFESFSYLNKFVFNLLNLIINTYSEIILLSANKYFNVISYNDKFIKKIYIYRNN